MRVLLVLTLLLALTGCGYHFPGRGGSLPGDVKVVHISLFVNKTSKPQLENKLTNRVSVVFSRSGDVTLVKQEDQAEAILEGTVVSYETRPLSYNQNDDISEYRATIKIDAKLRQVVDGRLLWSGTLSWSETYIAASNKTLQSDLEDDAIDEIVLRISDELWFRMLDNF